MERTDTTETVIGLSKQYREEYGVWYRKYLEPELLKRGWTLANFDWAMADIEGCHECWLTRCQCHIFRFFPTIDPFDYTYREN